MPRLINLRVNTNPVPTSEEIKQWLGDSADDVVPAVKAQGRISFHYVPKVGDTLTVNGITYTFIAGASAGTDIQIKGSISEQATEVAARLNDAGANAAVAAATYTVEGADVVVVHDTAGAAGNSFTLKSSSSVNNMSLSGPKNSKLQSRTIEVTPRLTGGENASTGYGEVIQNFIND
jgi:phage tail sheath gpL-like